MNLLGSTMKIVLIQDKESKGYTSYFAQFPQVISEGDTIEAAVDNLWILMRDTFLQQTVKTEEIETSNGFENVTIIELSVRKD